MTNRQAGMIAGAIIVAGFLAGGLYVPSSDARLILNRWTGEASVLPDPFLAKALRAFEDAAAGEQ